MSEVESNTKLMQFYTEYCMVMFAVAVCRRWKVVHCNTKMMQFNTEYCTVSHVMVISIVAVCWRWKVVHSVCFENSRWAQSWSNARIVGIVMVMKNDDDALFNGNMNSLFYQDFGDTCIRSQMSHI